MLAKLVPLRLPLKGWSQRYDVIQFVDLVSSRSMELLSNRIVLPVVVVAMAAVLIVVAILQYRWTTQLSDADEAQSQAQIQSLMMNWHLDFYREFSGAASSLQPGQNYQSQDYRLAHLRRYHEWARSARYPMLISDVLVLQSGSTLSRLNLRRSPGILRSAGQARNPASSAARSFIKSRQRLAGMAPSRHHRRCDRAA